MSFRSARENAGYTQQDIARLLGIDGTTPGKWELGKTQPRAATLVKLSALYNCPIEQLLEPDVREPPEQAE